MPQLSEAQREYHRAYYQNHRDSILETKVAYYNANRDAIRGSQADYRTAHKEEAALRSAAHYQKNKDAILDGQAEFTEWLQILRTINGCLDCETHEGRLEHHHVDPSTKRYNVTHMYGHSLDLLEDELEKCVVVCVPCHKARHKALKSVKREELLAMGEA